MKIWRSTDPEPFFAFRGRAALQRPRLVASPARSSMHCIPSLDEITSRTYAHFERELQAPILEMMLRGVQVDLRSPGQELLVLYRQQNAELQESPRSDLARRVSGSSQSTQAPGSKSSTFCTKYLASLTSVSVARLRRDQNCAREAFLLLPSLSPSVVSHHGG